MKNYLQFILFLLFVSGAFGANIQIENITTTAVLPATDDFTVWSGPTYTTRKFAPKATALITANRTSLAALSITGAADGIGIIVLGATAAGDGLGGTYYWSAASTATPNGSTIIQPASLPGTGRWLIAIGSVGTPGVSTLGGVFSNAGATHKFVSAINTDGTVTLTQPSISDVTGLGTMASQASNSITVTGGTIDGTAIGGTTKAAGGFTTLTTTGNITYVGATNGGISASDGTVTGGFFPISGPALAFGTTSNHSLSFWINSSAVGQVTGTGLNGIVIGATTRAAGSFNALAATTGAFSGQITSTVTTGSPPFVVASTSLVSNLHAATADAATTATTATSATTATNTTNVGITDDNTTNGTFNLAWVTSNTGNLPIKTSSTKLNFNPNTGLLTATGFSGPLTGNVTGSATQLLGQTWASPAAIGTGTPAAITATTLAVSSITNLRTTKGNLNIGINVKDYGTNVGGGGDDTAAFTAAVAALPSTNGVLYIPAGVYSVTTNDLGTSGLSINGKTGLTVHGDGWGSTTVRSRNTGAGSRCIHVLNGCSNVDVYGITFDGACTTRSAGGQAVMADANHFSFHDNCVINSGEFAVCLGRVAAVSDVIIANNYIGLNYADGINLYQVTGATVTGNVIDGPDDDLVAVGLSSKVTVSGNVMRARSDLGTTWGRGLAIIFGSDGVVCANNYIEHVKQYGIYISADGGSRCNDITISNTEVRNVCLNSGHAIALQSSDNVTFEGLRVYNPSQGNLMELRDWNNCAIRGGVLTQTGSAFCRGIHADEDGSLSGTWSNLIIKDVTINLTGAGANSCIYLNPTAAVTMSTISITGVTGNQVTAADYILVSTTRTSTIAKIGNNTKLQAGNTVNPASSTGIFTVYNNF